MPLIRYATTATVAALALTAMLVPQGPAHAGDTLVEGPEVS